MTGKHLSMLRLNSTVALKRSHLQDEYAVIISWDIIPVI